MFHRVTHQVVPKVVVFTNQGGIRTGKVKVADYVHKIEAIAAKLGAGVPLQLFAAAGEGRFRKPRVGLWNLLAEKFNGSVDIDLGEMKLNRDLFVIVFWPQMRISQLLRNAK